MNDKNDTRKGCSSGCSKIIFRIIGVIIVLISLPFVLAAIGSVVEIIGINSEISQLKKIGVLAQAEISEINAHYRDGSVDSGFKSLDFDAPSPISYEVFVDFVTADNRRMERIELTAISSELKDEGEVGSVVEIYYNPENPHEIVPTKYKSSWVPLVLLGAVPLALGLFLIFSNFYVTLRFFSPESDNFEVKNPIDIHSETAVWTVTAILERSFSPYQISNAEADNLIKFLKKKYPSLIAAGIFALAVSVPVIVGGLVTTIRDSETAGMLVMLFFAVILVLGIAIVFGKVRKNRVARDHMIRSIESGRIRGFEFFIDGKKTSSHGLDSSFLDYYIKVGEHIFEISGREYYTLYKGEKAVALIIEGQKNTEFRFFGAESLRTGNLNLREKER